MHANDTHLLAMLIATVGTALLLLIPVAIVMIVLRHRRDMAAQKHKTILELVSKGVPLPTELLVDFPQNPGSSDLRRGLVFTCTGIGAIIFALTLPDHEAWGVGLLPLFVGVGYLATWLFTKSDKLPDGDA